MAAPVWVLSVDLQTKTATFQTGLADAAKAARGSFNDIKSGANEMGAATGYSMMEARHSVMILGEEFGVHLPRALTSFIASIGPLGGALEAAFPFLAIALGATLLIEHLVKMHEAGEKLTDDQVKFGTAVNNAYNALDTKIIQAQIRADELKNDHLGALRLQLELIDKQSMEELVHSFEEVAKAADVVMKDLEGHWYTWGKGSEGAKHALDQFQTQYESLAAQGKDEAASGLLHGTLDQAQKALKAMQQMQSSGRGSGNPFAAFADPAKFHAAADELERMGIAVNPDHITAQVEAQQQLVDALSKTVGLEQRIATIKNLEGSNVKTQDTHADAEAAKERQRQQDEALKEGRTLYLSELFQQYKGSVESIQQGEKANLEATKQGTAERLTALNDAIKREEADGLQGTAFYRELCDQRIELQEHMDEESRKLQAQSDAEDIKQDEAMELLQLAGDRGAAEARLSVMRTTAQQKLALDEQMANQEYAIKRRALDRELSDLDKADVSYLLKLKQLQNQETQLTQQHENQLASIREKAEEETNSRLAASYQQFTNTVSGELTKSIMGHQSWAKTIDSLGDQMISGMIKNAIMYAMSNKARQESDAKAAATAGFKLGMEIGGPAGAALGPVFAAVAFAGAMAFEGGGIVPGTGRGDIVPAMLTPGEGVVPKSVMEGLSNMVKFGGMDQGKHIHVHGVTFAPKVHALDADGVDRVLTNHQDTFQRHFESTLRRMNH